MADLTLWDVASPVADLADHPFWQRRSQLFTQLTALGAPADLFDPAFLLQCRAATADIEVYWDQELVHYVRWWLLQPPRRQHRNRQQGFRTWLARNIASYQWRQANGRARR